MPNISSHVKMNNSAGMANQRGKFLDFQKNTNANKLSTIIEVFTATP